MQDSNKTEQDESIPAQHPTNQVTNQNDDQEIQTQSSLLQRLETELKIRGYSKNTIDAYSLYNKLFLDFIKKPPHQISEIDIKKYIAVLMENNLKPSSVRLVICAIKFFYHKVMQKQIISSLMLPKLEKKLPSPLTNEEIEKFLANIKNFKHRILVELMLSSGLRVSEAVNLKIDNISFNEGIINVRSGKGKKDRITIISPPLLEKIRSLILKESQSKTNHNSQGQIQIKSQFLFPSKDPLKPITIKLAQKIVKQASIKANLGKNVYCHLLRTTFATRLLEQGVDIRKIQLLLGHSSISTTQIYTIVSKEEIKKIKNPFDAFISQSMEGKK